MKVLKFGGTSVGSIQSLVNVKKIVESIPGKAIIVVSALGGLTDKLIAAANSAARGDEWQQEMDGFRKRHFEIIDAVVNPEKKDEVVEKVSSLLDDLQRNYEGVSLLRSLPENILNVIVSFGERMSSIIVASMVGNGKRYYSPDFVKTEKWYGKNIADRELTDRLIKKTFEDMGDDEKAIVPGFISTDTSSGEITNLGRGGSDYTGALIAAALDAEVLEIWTDVNGFMTADPRVVKGALIIDHLTFPESMELCNFGAKVIYPPTIYPVFHKNIPIKILNTFNPSAPGTLVTDRPRRDDFDIKGVSALKDISLIEIPVIKPGDETDYLKRAFNVLSKQAVSIIPLANSEPDIELQFAVPSADAVKSLEALIEEFAPEIADGKISDPATRGELVALAVVGKEMKEKERLAARLVHSLRREGIEVEATSGINSNTTLVFIIKQEDSALALPLVHSLLF